MSLKTHEEIHKEIINILTQNDTLFQFSKDFKELKTDYERVLVSYILLKEYNLLPNESENFENYKSAQFSEKYRNHGNQTFVQKEDMLAMHYYTLAVAYGPLEGKELPLAYANRSAVTFSLAEYNHAIKDIDKALTGDYPQHLKYKLFERKGKSLYQLGRYEEAKYVLNNSLLALDYSNLDEIKSEALQSELSHLIDECSRGHERIIQEESISFNLPSLLNGPSPDIGCASSGITIKHCPIMGRCVVATTDISPGDILAIEDPYVSVPLSISYTFFCFYCHKRCHSMVPCLRCSKVLYCDEICRDKSWNEDHSIECLILPALITLGCDKIEFLAVRVLIKATNSGKSLYKLATSIKDYETYTEPSRKGFSGDKYISNDYISIHNLEGNTHLRNVSNLFSHSVFASCILYILDTSSDFFKYSSGIVDYANTVSHSVLNVFELERQSGIKWENILVGGLLLKYLQSMGSNAHEISEMRIVPQGDQYKSKNCEIASAAYPLLSLINHSCDPNVVRHSYNGAKVILSAIQSIKMGEQIFDNYGFHHATHTLAERQSSLRSHYYFTCQCLACQENWPLYCELPEKGPYIEGADVGSLTEMSKKFDEILNTLLPKHISDEVGEWLEFLYSYLKLLEISVIRPWKAFSECQEVIKQCLSCKVANHYVFRSEPKLPLIKPKNLLEIIYY